MRLQDLGTRKDLYMLKPSLLTEQEGFNVREETPELEAHIQGLMESIKANGVLEPLTVRLKGEQVVVVNGHCRLAAVRRLLLQGTEILSVPCRVEDKNSTEGDSILAMLSRNAGKPLTALETAEVFRRLFAYGWSMEQVEARSGYSRAHVGNMLKLASAPPELRVAVQEKVISPSTAIQLIRDHGSEAPAILAEASKEGKKVTAKRVKKEAPLPVLEEIRAMVHDWKLNRVTADETLRGIEEVLG